MIMKLINLKKKIYKRFVLSNVYCTDFNKNALMVYIQEPFIYKEENCYHQNIAQVRIIADIFKELGYNVDVIDYTANKVRLKKKYDAVFDICVKNPAIYNRNIDCNTKRIVYFTGMESVFANSAEKQRMEDLFKRRGVYLQLRRQAPLIDCEVENFDAAIMIGNAYNLSSYRGFNLKKKYLVSNTGYDFSFIFNREMKKSTSFLFFGSAGCVHKGLDLLLEAFLNLGIPYVLHVCGAYETEQDFYEEYKTELLDTNNIIPHGFVDVKSDSFKAICDECTFAIMPSCSEACAGAIAVCMSAGLIPICSKECGYDEDEVILLKNCSLNTIQSAIVDASNMSMNDIQIKSELCVKLTKGKYSLNNFRDKMKKAIGEIINA